MWYELMARAQRVVIVEGRMKAFVVTLSSRIARSALWSAGRVRAWRDRTVTPTV